MNTKRTEIPKEVYDRIVEVAPSWVTTEVKYYLTADIPDIADITPPTDTPTTLTNHPKINKAAPKRRRKYRYDGCHLMLTGGDGPRKGRLGEAWRTIEASWLRNPERKMRYSTLKNLLDSHGCYSNASNHLISQYDCLEVLEENNER